MFPFIVAGVVLIGGGIVVLFRTENSEDTKNLPDNSKDETRNPQVSNFDLDKVRQARRELRYQMRQKKKMSSNNGGNTSNNGEEE